MRIPVRGARSQVIRERESAKDLSTDNARCMVFLLRSYKVLAGTSLYRTLARFVAARCLRHPGSRGRPVVEDEVGGDPGDRHRRGGGVARELHRHDGGIDDAQPGDAADAQLGWNRGLWFSVPCSKGIPG
jgi:hypothetical protein